MANFGHHPPSRRSKTPLVLLFVFLGMAALGFLLVVAGYFVGMAIGFTIGLLFLMIGVVGAIVSGVVLLAQPKSSAPMRPQGSWPGGAAAGWYPDPQNPGVMRYFDGRMWTASIQPARY